MRLHRSFFLARALLLLSAAGVAQAETLLSLGASTPGTSGCSLSGGQVCTLTARVTGIAPATVTWDFSPSVANAVIGPPAGPDNTGLTRIAYTAPNFILTRQTVVATATAIDGTRASVFITLVPPTVAVQVTPASVTLLAGQIQRFTATVSGISQTGVTWSISPQVGSVVINGNTIDYTAPSPITATQTITLTATSTFDSSVSGTGRVQLNAPGISISPTTASLTNSKLQQFIATVSNLGSAAVTWSISPQVGTIDQNGLYSAPAFLTISQKVTVTVTSVADPTKTASATVTLTPLATVGSGAPNEIMTAAFQGAWNRNGFNALVVLPPIANVRTFGNSGYVQEFTDAANSSLRDALVTGSPAAGGPNAVFQILAPLWAYYSSTGANTAGYPLGDSQTCSAQGVACAWGAFDRSYVLFSYTTTLPNGAGPNFMVNGAFFTEWTALGAINGLGSPVSAPTANVTGSVIAPATTGTTATVQSFANGAIYSITSGPNRNKTFGVAQPIYDLYVSQSGPAGALGMPTTEAYPFAAGIIRQNFEGGVLQVGGGDPSVLLPVASIALSGAQAGSTITLNVGQTVALTATPIITTGEAAPNRPVSWSSTNGKVVSIQANGGAAVITALASGSASVQAASQGVSSGRVNFIVIARCCQLGEGAPASVSQAFQDAIARNKLTIEIPLPGPAERVGQGYVQVAPSPDGKSSYLLTQSDRLGTAYVVAGALLARYQSLGGPAGALGYPAGDASGAGTQLFANGALGGTPVRVVAGLILSKWSLLGFENGAVGLPVSDALPFSTIGANSGQQQGFSKGRIYAATSGPRAGQAYFSTGQILARYEALGGAAGDFGMPTSDEFATAGQRQQNFEGGNITYSPGDGAAVEHPVARAPAVIVAPAAVSAGGRARIAVSGFPNGSALRISLSGSPDFNVSAANGAYSWEMAVPLAASSGSIAIRVVDGKGSSAEGALTVRGFADNRVQLTKLQGDNQTGLPGALLPLPLRVALLDASGSPVAGAPLTLVGSPGVQLSASTAITDSAGQAQFSVRLPAAAGVGGVNVSAPSIAQRPVTFSLIAAKDTLENFPPLRQAGDAPLGRGTATIARKGALLAAVASILRYHQNRGELRAPNGQADPAQLNEFLTQYCTVDSRGAQICDGFLAADSASEQVVNLWRAAEFTGGVDVSARSAALSGVLDALSEGSPVLISLALSRDGAPAGGHYVVAIGAAEDGSILIHDPNPALGRANLNDYLLGYVSGGVSWSGEIRGAVQFALRNPSPRRFLLGAVSQAPEVIQTLALEVQSVSGNCGMPMDLIDAVDGSGNPSGGLTTRLRACDGGDEIYQVAVGAARPYRAFLADLATAGTTVDLSGSSAATYKISRDRVNLVVAPQEAGFSADAVVNAATFTPGIAPGGIMSIFGAGLAGTRGATKVEVEGVDAVVLSATPFQVNAVVPAGVQPGTRSVEVRSPFGSARRNVEISDTAPAIFLIGNPPIGAVLNQDWSINSSVAPLRRGQTLIVYATGLGVTVSRRGLSEAVEAVTVVLNGAELPAAFAGLTVEYPGLYQVNVVVPADTPPGVGLALALKQGARLSNAVPVTVQ